MDPVPEAAAGMSLKNKSADDEERDQQRREENAVQDNGPQRMDHAGLTVKQVFSDGVAGDPEQKSAQRNPCGRP